MTTLSPEQLVGKHADRKRGKRGGRRKRRAGERRHQKKTERLRRKNLLVGYWNCRSTKQRGRILDRLIFDFDILCLQETNAEKSSWPEYCCYTNPVSQTHHGQHLLVRRDVEHRLVEVSSQDMEDREVQAVEVVVKGKKWVLVNLYVGNDSATTADGWTFLEELGKLGERVIIMGDFNARSHTWGNITENPQGKALDQALDEGIFTNMNVSVMTRLAQRDGEHDSNIDLTLVKHGAEASVQWRALMYQGSDHLPCSVQIRTTGTGTVKKMKKPFCYKGTSIPALDNIRRRAWAPKLQPSRIAKPPYWTDELEGLWLSKKNATKAWQKVKNDPRHSDTAKTEARDNMRRETTAFKKVADEAKRAKWEAFAKEVSSEKALQKFWKLHKRMNNAQGGRTATMQDELGNTLQTDEARGRAFMERYMAQTHQGNIAQRKDTRDSVAEFVPDIPYGDPVTKEEVLSMLKKAKDSAAGPDGVKYSHVKESPEEDVDALVEAFNESLETGTIPEEWLHSYLLPLPKPGKDHTKLNGYRIITMQNTVGKILEKVVASRLTQHLERERLLPDGLGSYRPGRDTCVNTATLAQDVFEGFQEKKETIIAAIDLEDAYNRVSYDTLMDTLLELDLDPWLLRWIAEALLKRKVALRSGKWVSDIAEIAPGLPQGSALSPVLFNIYTSKVASTGVCGSGRVLTFADDVTVYEQGKDRLNTTRRLQRKLDTVAEWCRKHSAIINPSKAQVLWCSLNNRIVQDQTPPVTFEYEVIDRQHELKSLGVTFDRTLSFKKHIDNTAVKVKRGINAIKTMASARVEQHVLFLMMQLVVLSVIDFGLGCLTLSGTQIQRLDRLQNEAMRAVLGCTRDTHIICMRYLLDLSSMKIRHKMAQARMYLKVAEDETHPLHLKIKDEKGSRLKRGKSWMAEAEDSLRKVCELDDLQTGKEWIKLTSGEQGLTRVIVTMGREQRDVADIVTEQEILSLINENSKPGDPVIYTDGSVRRGVKSGWGFIALQNNKVMHRASGATAATTSSMKMEIVAITRALEWICRTQPNSTHLVFLTDSQSTLRRIEKGLLRSEWIDAIQGSKLRSIVWIFCPGHAGVRGNEAADRLAGEATVGDSIMPDRADILDRLWKKLREEEDRETDEHHAVQRMQEMGVMRGDGRKLALAGRERRVHNQTRTGTVSMDTLRVALARGTEHLWTCPQCNDVVAPTKV